MEDQNITYGVDQRLVDRLSHDESRYFNLFLIAKGKPAFDGRWARTVVVPSPKIPLTTVRSPPASTVLPASMTPPTQMLPMARTVKPVSWAPSRSAGRASPWAGFPVPILSGSWCAGS